MRNGLFFKQSKPFTVIVLGIVFLTIAALVLIQDATQLEQIITMSCIGIILLGYSISFEMKENYDHKKHFKIFGATIFKGKLKCFIPEYATIFSATGIQNSEWGPVAAMGNQRKDQNYVVRLFKGNQHFTLLRTTSYDIAKDKAEKLGVLLKIEVHIET